VSVYVVEAFRLVVVEVIETQQSFLVFNLHHCSLVMQMQSSIRSVNQGTYKTPLARKSRRMVLKSTLTSAFRLFKGVNSSLLHRIAFRIVGYSTFDRDNRMAAISTSRARITKTFGHFAPLDVLRDSKRAY
jgi:hypothetical protein